MSKIVPLPADQAAAAWFATQRRGVMTLEEREAFALWRRDPANAAAYAELEQVWAMLQSAEGLVPTVAAPQASARRQRIARSALLAAVCVASIGLGVLSYSGNPEFWTTLDWIDR